MQFGNLDNWQDKPIPAPRDDEYPEVAWGINKCGEDFSPITINRPKVGANDVKVDMHYCGICHTDVHIALNHLGGTMYPIVPGHELVGVVEEVGAAVTKVKVGDKVGIGCLCDACFNCSSCKKGEEQYCQVDGWCHIYNDKKKYGHIGGNPDTQTFGGYSGSQVLHEHFIMKVPDALPLEQAGPLLCAGITMWDPLRHWGATKGDKKMTIGIIGVGGLGTMGIKLAHHLGHRVVAISTSASKEAMAKSKGADAFVVSTDPASLAAEARSCDLILNTVAAAHDLNTYTSLLAESGTLVQLGVIGTPHSVNQLGLIMQRKSIAGSLIGGIKSTEEMLEFCAKH